MKTCILADDHFITRDGLKARFGASRLVKVIGEAATGAEAVALIDELRPDIAIVDMRMPEGNGIDVVSLLAALGCTVPVIIFSGLGDASLADRALRAGAAGYVSKQTSPGLLDRAIERVLSGHRFIDPEVAMSLLEATEHTLTRRECDVLVLASNGLPNKTIAHELDIGIETVRSHMALVIQKLGADNRTGAVAKALRMSLID